MIVTAQVIGSIVMVVLGLLGAIASLLAVSYVAGIVGQETFKRLRRVYHISVIGYWLDRLEREGTHVFQKTQKDQSNG